MEKQTLGDQPIEEIYRQKMNILAHELDEALNGDLKGDERTVGFVLLVFEFGSDGGRCNYISNAHREDVVNLLREQLKKFEGAPDGKANA